MWVPTLANQRDLNQDKHATLPCVAKRSVLMTERFLLCGQIKMCFSGTACGSRGTLCIFAMTVRCCHCEEKLCFDAAIQCALAASVSGQWIATRPLAIRDDGVVFD